MLRLFRNSPRPRVFLGTLAVAPRVDLWRWCEDSGKESSDLHFQLSQALTEIFDLPPLAEVAAPQRTDLALDVVVARFQAGGAWCGDVHVGTALPLFWLWVPKIELRARLYRAKTHKTLRTFRIRERLGWREVFRRIMNGNGFVFDWPDLEGVLCRASYRLLARVQREIGA